MPGSSSSSRRLSDPASESKAVFHLLGCVPYDKCADLQRRLAAEASWRGDGRITVLLAEHPPHITVGRRGSWAHLGLSAGELERRQISVRWVSRMGGCILHAPGQLAIYPVVPLAAHQWTLADYRRRLHSAMQGLVEDWGIRPAGCLPGAGIWGRTGAIGVYAVGEHQGITHHGCYLNVNPAMEPFGHVHVVPPDQVLDGVKTTMSCLLAENRQPVRMASVRAAAVSRLATAFNCTDHHLVTGHPGL